MMGKVFGLPMRVIEGGLLVKTVNGRDICVMRMMYNWRLVRNLPGGDEYDRAWCYYGTGADALMRAVAAAAAWDGADDSEPEGWDKDAIAGRYARPLKSAERTDPWVWYCRLCGAKGAVDDGPGAREQRDLEAAEHLRTAPCGRHGVIRREESGRLLHVWTYGEVMA